MSPSTVAGYAKSLSIWGEVFDPEPVTAIRRSQILDVIAVWEWSGKTLSNRLTPLRALFDLMIDDEIEGMRRNPAMRIKAPGAQRSRPTPLTPGEIALCLAACEEHQPAWLPYWLVAIGTGMRPSEQIELKRAACDFQARTVLIHEARVENSHRSVTKSRRERTIDLTPMALRGLRLQREQRLAWGGASLAHEHVFLHPTTLRPIIDEQPPRRSWNRMLADAGVPHRKAYSSRCTFACNLLADGVDLFRVSQLLGHASPRMTLDHYAEWIPQEGPAGADVRAVAAFA